MFCRFQKAAPSGWLLKLAEVAGFWLGGFLTKILKSTSRLTVACANALIMSHFYLEPSQGGFQVDSPVKKPRASEMARQAPPYTDRAREEPWEGDDLFVTSQLARGWRLYGSVFLRTIARAIADALRQSRRTPLQKLCRSIPHLAGRTLQKDV